MSDIVKYNFESIFLEMLNDTKIIEKIKEITQENLIDNSKLLEYETKIQELEKVNSILHQDNQKLQNEIDTVLNEKLELQNKNQEIQKKVELYGEREKKITQKLESVEHELDMWDKLNNLPQECKNYIGKLAGEYSVLACLSLGRELSKIKQLYQYVQGIAISGDVDSNYIKILDEYWMNCVNIYNLTQLDDEKLQEMPVVINTNFDLETCFKTSCSKNTGLVAEILIHGFANQKNVFKNVVHLE